MPRRRHQPARGAHPPRIEDLLYPSLDLHGEGAEAARRRTERWLDERLQEGARTVRVITGWGKHSIGPPVLPAAIEALLVEITGSVVARFGREPGGGAYRVELLPGGARAAPRRRTAATPPPDTRPVDPDLRRRAEESLSELGISPTPELIRAEMGRLRAETD